MGTLRTHPLTPIVGGVTAAVTAAGAVVATTNVAPALAAPEAAAAPDASSAFGGGALESCEAYFGYGKDAGGSNLVEFDVADVNGDDGVEHAVPADTEVVLVIETEGAGTIECTPFEVTEEDWDDEWGGAPFDFPAYPGPGHYVYPSVAFENEIDDPADEGDATVPVTSVGYRVTTTPEGHTLESPTGVQPLTDHWQILRGLFDFEDVESFQIDPRLLELVEAEAGAAAAEALSAARDECVDPANEDGTLDAPDDPDLLAALQVALGYIGFDEELSDADCDDVFELNIIASLVLTVQQSTEYVETISLSVPEAEPTTTTTTEPAVESDDATPAPAASPTQASPTFTG